MQILRKEMSELMTNMSFSEADMGHLDQAAVLFDESKFKAGKNFLDVFLAKYPQNLYFIFINFLAYNLEERTNYSKFNPLFNKNEDPLDLNKAEKYYSMIKELENHLSTCSSQLVVKVAITKAIDQLRSLILDSKLLSSEGAPSNSHKIWSD